jgi:hypothetical protein
MAITLGNIRDAEADFSADSLWDDEDTQTFYENLVDLRAFVPAVLLGEKEKEKPQPRMWAECRAAWRKGKAQSPYVGRVPCACG